MPGDAVLDALNKAADDRVRSAEPGDAIDAVEPKYVATPGSTEETAELLRVAAHHRLHVVARGSGTKQHWGNPPTKLDLVLDTTALRGVVEHAAGDLIAVVRAGTTMTELQLQLGEQDQQLALDAPLPSATLGGTVATNTSGPRRVLYGTMRDLLIGITFVRADGVVAKAGGKVVKNVAGYDFGKLLTGSYGTLGVITEVALRLHPLPASRRYVTVEKADGATAAEAGRRVLAAQAVPTAVDVDQPAEGPTTVTALVEGGEAGASARSAAVAEVLGTDRVELEPPTWFGRYPFADGDVGLKITCTHAGVGPILAVARRLDAPASVRGSVSGVLFLALPGAAEPDVVSRTLADLRALAGRYDGTVLVLAAPAATRHALDMWGPVPGLDLMRRLKDQLDPEHRLAPGRFVGGI